MPAVLKAVAKRVPTRNGTGLLWSEAKEVQEDKARPESTAIGQPIVLRFMGLYRYTVDRMLLTGTRETTSETEAYDVVLSDGLHKIKVVLSTSLNPYIRRGIIPVGTPCLLEIKRCVIRWDEVTLPARGFLFVQDFNVIPVGNEPTTNPSFYDMSSTRERELLPMAGSRKFYRSLYNEDDLLEEDERTHPKVIESPEKQVQLDHPTIQEILRLNTEAPLLGMVTRKSRLFIYAKPGDEKDAYPMNFHFEIADSSTSVEVVAWNHLALKLFATVKVGELLLIDKFKTSRAYGKAEGVQVNLNERNPTAIIRLLRPDTDWPQAAAERQVWNQRFPTPKVLHPTPDVVLKDKTMVDLEGWILFLGRRERERLPRDSSAFSEYRYVVLQSGLQKLWLKLYTCSHSALIEELVPGSYLKVTSCKVMSYMFDSYRQRTVYYVTTMQSQPSVFSKEEAMENDIAYDNELQASFGCGGFFRPQPRTETIQDVIDVSNLRPIYFRQVFDVINSLAIYERTSAIVQGVLTSVHFGNHFANVPFKYRELEGKKTVVKGVWRRNKSMAIDLASKDRSNIAGLQRRRAARNAQKKTRELIEKWNPHGGLNRAAKSVASKQALVPAADGGSSSSAAAAAVHDNVMDTGAENSNGNENDSSEDEDNLPVEIIVNPNRLADTITSSTSNIILKPFFDEEEDGEVLTSHDENKLITMRISNMDNLHAISAVCQPQWKLGKAVPRGPVMQGFLDCFPEEFGFKQPGLTLQSDNNLYKKLARGLEENCGDSEALAFHFDIYRESYDKVQIVVVGVYIPTSILQNEEVEESDEDLL